MKKLRLLPLLLLGIIMVSCGEKPKKENTEEVEETDSEQLALERGDSIYKETTAYYPGEGRLVRQKFMGYVFLKNGKKTAIRHGEQKSYWKSGKLQAITQYENNKKQGLEVYYYEDGVKKMYERNYVDGKKDGIVKKYYRSGRLMSETPYKRDFLGTGTQTYADTEEGTKLTMPELVVWAKDERRTAGKYTVYAKVVNKFDKTVTAKIQFFSGMTISSDGRKYMHPNLKEVKHKNGVASITYYESTGFPQFESISAKFISTKGAPVFLTKVHTIN